jgi:hypothetical protein
MPERSYSPGDLVAIPVLDAPKAIALAQALDQAARGATDLPPLVQKALDQVRAAQAVLTAALAAKVVDGAGAGPDVTRAADQVIDAVWRAFHAWLQAFTKLPVHLATDQVASAQQLLSEYFADGLQFTQAAFRAEWAESGARLQSLAQTGRDALVRTLGGDVFLQALGTAHQAYGEALGLTADRAAPPVPARVKEPLQALQTALRTYVVRIAGQVDEDDPKTGALARKLLAPLSV